jgi:hypothetical protein
MVGCTSLEHQHIYSGSRAVDFSKGKLLVNNIDTGLPPDEALQLHRTLIERLVKAGIGPLVLIENLRKESGFAAIPFEPETGDLKLLNQQGDFHYLLNVRTWIENINGSVILNSGWSSASVTNQVEVEIAVYDIPMQTLIYHQRVITQEVANEDDDSSLIFTKTGGNIAEKSLRRGIQKLKRHSLWKG